eukprot:1348847-Amphidinium_carterae.1
MEKVVLLQLGKFEGWWLGTLLGCKKAVMFLHIHMWLYSPLKFHHSVRSTTPLNSQWKWGPFPFYTLSTQTNAL